MKPIVIAGAGGFGREVCNLIQDINAASPTWRLIGFLDDDSRALERFSHYPPLLGPIEAYRDLDRPAVVCAVGRPALRTAIVDRLNEFDAQWTTLVHPTAVVGVGSTLGAGTIICRGATVTVDVVLGQHVHVNCGAVIGHDARLASYCTLSCFVDICGAVQLGEGVFLGSHASVLPCAKVDSWATVGAGSVVLQRVVAGETVFGVPAKRLCRSITPDG